MVAVKSRWLFGDIAPEAAHVRWFAFDGPDSLDKGLALYSLHHKLLDLGVLGPRRPAPPSRRRVT
jgi:hypothetical protein